MIVGKETTKEREDLSINIQRITDLDQKLQCKIIVYEDRIEEIDSYMEECRKKEFDDITQLLTNKKRKQYKIDDLDKWRRLIKELKATRPNDFIVAVDTHR